MAAGIPTINRDLFDAVLFDLDGVITRTAEIHTLAWKTLFDEYLEKKSNKEAFVPFDSGGDYLRYVDGKPRYKGIESFMISRGIHLSWGTVYDSADQETICGLGNRKNQIFSDLLQTKGVRVYESTIDLIKQLKKKGFKIAVVSSSKNCSRVLKAADIDGLFDARVDGVVAENMGLQGKPAPDTFLEAAKRLSVQAVQCVVVEDALSGVAAGIKGGFGMVIGVNRGNQKKQLRQQGAHWVVKDLWK